MGNGWYDSGWTALTFLLHQYKSMWQRCSVRVQQYLWVYEQRILPSNILILSLLDRLFLTDSLSLLHHEQTAEVQVLQPRSSRDTKVKEEGLFSKYAFE